MTDTDTQLYAIFRPLADEPVWAKVCTKDEAEEKAVVAAVNGGNCELLDGRDLALRLMQSEAIHTLTVESSSYGAPVTSVHLSQEDAEAALYERYAEYFEDGFDGDFTSGIEHLTSNHGFVIYIEEHTL